MATEKELINYLQLLKDSNTSGNCPIKKSLDLIGGKWKLRILIQLFRKDSVRFNEFKKEIKNITNTMLSNSLQEMEVDGLVKRKQYNEIPVRVEYSLTKKAKSLLPLLYEIYMWGLDAN